MSSTLYWRPVTPTTRHGLPYTLKVILSRRYLGHDGSLHAGEYVLSGEDLEFLKGVCSALNDAELVAAAQMLIDAIQQYGRITIWTE